MFVKFSRRRIYNLKMKNSDLEYVKCYWLDILIIGNKNLLFSKKMPCVSLKY